MWLQQSCTGGIATGIIAREKMCFARGSCFGRGLHSLSSSSSGVISHHTQSLHVRYCMETQSLRRNIYNLAAVANGSITRRNDTGTYNHERRCYTRTYASERRSCKRVLVVGGGPTGLLLAHLLRSYNVPFRLIEAQTPEKLFEHPQAHFLNTRTMEILKHGLSYNNDEPNRLNRIYQEIRDSMAPVEEWKTFRFGPDMMCSSQDDRMMAEVVHPVDRSLIAEEDANGRLVSSINKNDNTPIEKAKKDGNIPLSPESVGHLAQHTFCRILYDALVQEMESTTSGKSSEKGDEIMYGRRVIGFDWNRENRRWSVQTDQEDLFDDIDMIVAADGAASSIRKNLFIEDSSSNIADNDSTMLGTQIIQRLINVHFTVHEEAAKKIPPAMLYTVFNPEVLAMCVRHGPREYVLQIPYFDPYQSPEEDFDMEKAREMVRSILGGIEDFTIQSIRPWMMGSLVARDYFTDKGLFLAGDAAHVFPPAGGFGMNTGLQDAFSLAWRIAYHRQREQLGGNDELDFPTSLRSVGELYERDRQPIARRNAALSVRNYNRVLNVMRACYLDDRHPALLIQALDASSSFVSLETRRQTFRALLKTALSPLSQLQTAPTGVYARKIKENLRSLLGSGQGLPLLFPKYELDFSYDDSERTSSEAENDWSLDTVASSPQLALGILFPHIVSPASFESLRRFPRLQPIGCIRENHNTESCTDDSNKLWRHISTRDLPAQLSTKENQCTFCLLEINKSATQTADDEQDKVTNRPNASLTTIQKTLQDTFTIPFVASRLTICNNSEARLKSKNENVPGDARICNLYVDEHQWESLSLISDIDSPQHFVAIRPDGHIAAISLSGNHSENLVRQIRSVLEIK